MKQIQPVNIWINGQIKQANYLGMYSINDDLSSVATFYYQLLKVTTDQNNNTNSQQLSQGNLTMSGTDYEDWGDNDNINQEAYVWAADQLNLVLV